MRAITVPATGRTARARELVGAAATAPTDYDGQLPECRMGDGQLLRHRSSASSERSAGVFPVIESILFGTSRD
ncbi:hypothetical protein ASG82_00340 [Mycobacterium sp. Soil538]|nr:hypothetical protein ASG82_00340 [Mycobacterium sp. Soil538]